MPYSIEVRSDPPVAVITFEGRIDFEKDVDTVFHWVVAHQHEVVDVIMNMTKLELRFSDMVIAAATAFKPREDRQQPDLDVVLVGVPDFFKNAANWLAQPQYGSRRVRVYDTLEEALEFSRQRAKTT